MASRAWSLAAAALLIACGGDDAPSKSSGKTSSTSSSSTGGGGAGGDGGQGGTPYSGPYEDNFVFQSRMEGSTFVEILEVRARDDNTVLFCSGVRGLNVVDVSDPAMITQTAAVGSSEGSFQYPRCQHIADAGDTVYMSSRGDEIQQTPFITAFDFTQSPPQEMASYLQPGLSFEGIVASGDLLYAAVHDDGVRILQDNGASIDLVGTLPGGQAGLTNAWGVALAGTTLFIADGSGGLKVADVSTPSSPSIIGSLPIAGPAQFVEIDADRNLAFVAAGAAGVVIVDVSDPSSPVELATFDTPGSALQVALSGELAFIADWNDARVIDVSDPAAPRLVATEYVSVSGFPRILGVAAIGDRAFLGEWTGLFGYQYLPDKTASDIRVAKRTIELGGVPAGEQAGAAILTTNEGPQQLTIHDIVVGGGTSLITTPPVSIAPGATQSIEVAVDGSDSAVNAWAELHSDDPDQSVLRVEIKANRPGIGVGNPAPAVTVDLVSGGTWTLASQLGNVVVLSYFATF